MRRTARVPLALSLLGSALLVASALVAPTSAGGCPSVRRSGAWTASALPIESVVANPVYDPGQLHAKAIALASGGGTGRLYASDGVAVYRTTDGLCTWKPVYSISLHSTTQAAQQPYLAVASADYTFQVRAVAARPGAGGRDALQILVADPYGIAENMGNTAPFLVAASTDGGAAWHTDLLQVPGAAGPVAPVLGSGTIGGAVAFAPTDPRVAYLTVDSHELGRKTDTSVTELGALYVTRDSGATWSFLDWHPNAGPIRVDPLDKNVVYVAESKTIRAITASSPPVSRTLFTADGTHVVESVDVVRSAGRPVQLLVTTHTQLPSSAQTQYELYRSADGGRRWTKVVVPPVFGALDSGTFVGDGALLAGNGDIVGVETATFLGSPTSLLVRWDARRRAWRRHEVITLPIKAGPYDLALSAFEPGDAARRIFLWGAWHPSKAELRVVGTYDAMR